MIKNNKDKKDKKECVIEFPLKPWQKATLNAFIVALITSFSTASSMLASGDWVNPHFFHSVIISIFLSGGLTFLVQINMLLKKDMEDDDRGSFHPLGFI